MAGKSNAQQLRATSGRLIVDMEMNNTTETIAVEFFDLRALVFCLRNIDTNKLAGNYMENGSHLHITRPPETFVLQYFRKGVECINLKLYPNMVTANSEANTCTVYPDEIS